MDLIKILPILQELFGPYHSIEILKLLDEKDKFKNTSISANYVYLNTAERQAFSNAPREYLIHQLSFN